MISIIVPVAVPWAPVESARCALTAISRAGWQCPVPIEVVVVDDSPDHTAEWVLCHEDDIGMLRDLFPKRHQYIRVSPPRVGRFTASRARNIGAANAHGKLLVFVDQDVLLAPDALANYWRAYSLHGDNVVIVGLYHWLRHIDFSYQDVATRFEDIVRSGLGESRVFKELPMDVPGLQGKDHRAQDFDGIDKVVDDASLGAHTGNLGVPHALFMKAGGFDENITRHGGEDADFGLTCKAVGAKWLLWDAIWGVHRWHSRDQAQNQVDVQFNIDYIDRKHGIGQYRDAPKYMDARDWGDERHYHKEVGGVAMKMDGDPTVWICREGHRIGIATPEALARLGFKGATPMLVSGPALEKYEVMGVAQ